MRLLAALLLLLLSWPCAEAQAPHAAVAYDGVEVFAHILHEHGKLQPVRGSVLDKVDPSTTSVIIFGDLRALGPGGVYSRKLKEFVERGGNLLIASDNGSLGAQWRVSFDKWIKADGYRGLPECPLIRRDTLPLNHPLFLGLQQDLATNSPRSLKLAGVSNLQPLARLAAPPSHVDVWVDQFDERIRQLLSGPFNPIYMAGSPAATPPAGRVLIVAGHGIFMNCMLVQPDCDNFMFAVNCVRWLRAGPADSARTHALFIVDGTPVEHFNPSLTPPAPMPTASLLDQLLTDLEDEGFFQRLVSEHSVSLMRGLLITTTILLLLYSAKKLLAARHHIDAGLPAPFSAETAPAALGRRMDELLARDNLSAAAQALASVWIQDHVPLAPARELPQTKPAVAVTGPFWRRWRLRRQFAQVWNVAQAGSARRVSRKRFLALQGALAGLTEAVQAGQLQINLSEHSGR